MLASCVCLSLCLLSPRWDLVCARAGQANVAQSVFFAGCLVGFTRLLANVLFVTMLLNYLDSCLPKTKLLQTYPLTPDP